MRALKKILIFHLVMLLLASGLPHFMGEDASRDHRIDLADAVLLVQDFARTAQEPGAFHAQVEKMFSALHVGGGHENGDPEIGKPCCSTRCARDGNARIDSPPPFSNRFGSCVENSSGPIRFCILFNSTRPTPSRDCWLTLVSKLNRSDNDDV